jgi:hypothetical protein
VKTSVLFLLTLVPLWGCGASGEMVDVSGTVKYADGSPVTGESPLVVFEPTAEGKAASGTINPDGTFEMMTLKPGDGVQPGKYKVVLRVFKNYRAQTLAVPEKYGSASTTPLEVAVDDDNTHLDFVVEK